MSSALDPAERSHQVTETPSAQTDANRATIRQAFDAWSAGTQAISDVFAPDMVWRTEGHSFNDLWTRVQPRGERSRAVIAGRREVSPRSAEGRRSSRRQGRCC